MQLCEVIVEQFMNFILVIKYFLHSVQLLNLHENIKLMVESHFILFLNYKLSNSVVEHSIFMGKINNKNSLFRNTNWKIFKINYR